MIKPQFETYRYVGEICRQKSQSIVECRLAGSEISTILAIHAKAAPTECVCMDGEVQYGGKLIIGIVYEDGDKKICRAERGAEFFHKAENALISPACFCRAELSSENVTWRREGSGLYISVIVDAQLLIYGNKQLEYLQGGEGLIAKKESFTVCKTISAYGETEGEDEFETECVGDLLMHSETATVNRISASGGQIDIEGEILLNFCVLKKDDSICSYERLIPYSMQLPSEEAFGKINVGGRVFVKSAQITMQLDEEKEIGKALLSYCLAAECTLSVCEDLEGASDAFSPKQELQLTYKKDGGRYLTKQEKGIERISGSAVLSPALDGEYTLCAAVLPRAELSCRKGEHGLEAEGAILAEVILKNADGTHRAATLSLPFLFPLEEKGDEAEADCLVCSLNIRRKKTGETEAEATLKYAFRVYENREWEYVSEVTEGEECPHADSAFSVFMTNAGEGLWEVSKRLGCAPEELKKSNPSLEFPLKAGERIYVYRQISEENAD
ncbi:MAG: hypothetical protein IJ393_06725 [Clostridia bacterium]|nr:hypothetical protein [Clostridia bacterium]